MRHNLFIILLVISISAFAQTTDANGKKQGYWKKKDEKTGKLIYEGMFKDDKPQGVFKYYYPHDSIKAIMDFRQDGKISYSTMFHLTTGKKMAYGKYIGEAKDSVWTYYDDKGVLISRETFKGGKKNGISYVYFPDGVVSEQRSFKMGVEDGPFKLYFDNVNVKGEGVYVNGKLEGKNAYYYPNGVSAAVGYYKNGQKVGPWLYRNSAGKVTEKELYKNGKLADQKETEAFFNKNKVTDEKPKTPATGTTTATPKPKTGTAKKTTK
jgi:antitoxin component YwqK of YwqJK toxin-antitoxin module